MTPKQVTGHRPTGWLKIKIKKAARARVLIEAYSHEIKCFALDFYHHVSTDVLLADRWRCPATIWMWGDGCTCSLLTCM